jgi:hypothetical protein
MFSKRQFTSHEAQVEPAGYVGKHNKTMSSYMGGLHTVNLTQCHVAFLGLQSLGCIFPLILAQILVTCERYQEMISEFLALNLRIMKIDDQI